MLARQLGKTLNTFEINHEIRNYRVTDNVTNLRYLFLEYLTLGAIATSTVLALHYGADWGIPIGVRALLSLLAIILMGGLQHRLAGLGHEASHYTFLHNRYANEIVSDLFCMFPLFATTNQYRLTHLAHHQFTNDWERDPDLVTIGKSKKMDQFPMTKAQFIANFYLKFLWPPTLLAYFWDVASLSALAAGESPYRKSKGQPTGASKVAGVLGMLYLVALVATLIYANQNQAPELLYWTPIVAVATATVVIGLLPARCFFQSPIQSVVPTKLTSWLRLVYMTGLFTTFAWLRGATGVNWGGYFLLLWVVPIFTSFSYFMLLRDVYQHANADEGKLTNTRVFYCDPFTRWAVFVYGMDMHVPHHMFPAIPHYRLPGLHEMLKQRSAEYRDNVVECHGVFTNPLGKPTILDTMWTPTREPATESKSDPRAA